MDGGRDGGDVTEQEPATPGEIILDFLDRLPVTIKNNVLTLCWFGMGNDDLVSLNKDDKLGELRTILDGACARLIAVLELVLEPIEGDLEKSNLELNCGDALLLTCMTKQA